MPPPLSATIIPLYDRHADAWHRRRSPHASLEEAWLTRFSAGLPGGACVLDLGCGTGQPMARWLVQRGFAITGVDSAATMLAHAPDLLPAQAWVLGDMRTFTLGRGFADVQAWDSFFHLSRRLFAGASREVPSKNGGARRRPPRSPGRPKGGWRSRVE